MDFSNLAYIVSALLAIILLIDVSVLWLTGKQVPDLLSELVIGVFVSYFASGAARARGRAAGVGESGSGAPAAAAAPVSPASKEGQ
jgi:hypothetical protein